MENIDDTLFVTSSALKCFKCGKEGHLARACPNCPGTATGPPPPAPASVSDCSEASPSQISDGQVKNVYPAEMYKVFLQRTKCMKGLDLKKKIRGVSNLKLGLKLNGLPLFYQRVFKAWALFKCTQRKSSDSLIWLLK